MTYQERLDRLSSELYPIGFGRIPQVPLPEGGRTVCGNGSLVLFCLKGMRESVFFMRRDEPDRMTRVARSLRGFLSLLVSVGDLYALLFLISCKDREAWEIYHASHPLSREQKRAVSLLEKEFGVRKNPDPYGAVRAAAETAASEAPAAENAERKDHSSPSVEFAEILF